MVAARAVAFTVRTDRAGTGALLNEIRQAIGSVSAALPMANPETMRETLDRSMARTSFTLVMLAIAGAMALLLGLIGIYGVIAYAVSQRTREIGIRLALGARPSDVRQMFVRHGAGLCALGIAIGLGAAALLTPNEIAVLRRGANRPDYIRGRAPHPLARYTASPTGEEGAGGGRGEVHEGRVAAESS